MENLPSEPFFSSAGRFLGSIRSRIWPTEACTSYPSPRYWAIVLAFAGDSTITSFFVPDTGLLAVSYFLGLDIETIHTQT